MEPSCEMKLDKPSGIYQAGETVHGHIYLTLPERELVKGLALEANGYAATAWLQPQKQKKQKEGAQPGKGKQKPPLAYEMRTDYLATVNYFVGSEAAVPKIIDGGIYHFAFSVPLPEHCPGSFEGAHGHIRYTLQLVLLKGNANERLVVHSRNLQLMQHCNLRQEDSAALAMPSELQQVERTPRLKFWQRPLQLNLNIPRSGYAPGEGISVHVQLHNPQQLPLGELIYKLNRLDSYVGQQRGKAKRRETRVERCNLLSSVHQLSGQPRSEHFQHLHNLQLPLNTPPTLNANSCQCLQLSYELEVIVKTMQRKRFIMAQMPLTICLGNASADWTAPTLANQRQLHMGSVSALAVAQSQDDLNVVAGPEATAPALTPTAMPETSARAAANLSASMTSLASNFREAEFMTATNLNKSNKHAMSGEQLDFKPRYIYYEMEHAEGEKML